MSNLSKQTQTLSNTAKKVSMFSFFLLLLFSSQISALTETSTKILCVDRYSNDIVFEIETKDYSFDFEKDPRFYIEIATEYQDGLKTKTKNTTAHTVRITKDYIIAELTEIKPVYGMSTTSYKFIKDESGNIKKVYRRIFKNTALLGYKNLEKRIEVSVNDSHFLGNCI